MNTSLTNNDPKLLVDIENGRILRGDDEPIVTLRWLDSHPFIETRNGGRTYFVGPDAARASVAAQRGESIKHLDAWEYTVTREIAGSVHLQRTVNV